MSGIGPQSYFSVTEFRQLNGPIIDLRTPKEFSQGHWPDSINIPLFDNDERAAVGKTYKEKGRKKAILLGLKFTGTKLLSISETLDKVSKSSDDEFQPAPPCLRLYCWRGGMRSSSVGWLADLLDLKPAILQGGYKTYRNWVLAKFNERLPIALIGGRTGTGKTDLLSALAQKGVSTIDLEGLANHRGSSFGGLGMPLQPTSEHYENLIAESLDNCKIDPTHKIWMEDESAHLGRCRIPHELFKQMRLASVIEIERSKKERIQQLVTIYSHQNKEELLEATTRINRRLGPQRTAKAMKAIEDEEWGDACLAMLDYYDRCYDHDLARSPHRNTVDMSGLTADMAAEKLLNQGLVN